MQNNNIDFSELQEEVMQSWEDNCVEFLEYNEIGFQSVETFIKPDFQEILDDPESCVLELGFDSIASYVASKTPNKLNLLKITKYDEYLEYLKVNKIDAPEWIKNWGKEIFEKGLNV